RLGCAAGRWVPDGDAQHSRGRPPGRQWRASVRACPTRVGRMWVTWGEAMRSALYGPAGFYARGEPAARHFRTSVQVSPRYGAAFLHLLREVDAALGHPPRLDL